MLRLSAAMFGKSCHLVARRDDHQGLASELARRCLRVGLQARVLLFQCCVAATPAFACQFFSLELLHATSRNEGFQCILNAFSKAYLNSSSVIASNRTYSMVSSESVSRFWNQHCSSEYALTCLTTPDHKHSLHNTQQHGNLQHSDTT